MFSREELDDLSHTLYGMACKVSKEKALVWQHNNAKSNLKKVTPYRMAVGSNYIFWIVDSGVIFLLGMVWKISACRSGNWIQPTVLYYFNASLDQLPYQIKVLFEFNIFFAKRYQRKGRIQKLRSFQIDQFLMLTCLVKKLSVAIIYYCCKVVSLSFLTAPVSMANDLFGWLTGIIRERTHTVKDKWYELIKILGLTLGLEPVTSRKTQELMKVVML